MEHVWKVFGGLLVFVSAVCGERCSYYDDSFFYTVRCAYGCCGHIHGPYCCNFSDIIGRMAGIVAGCVFGLMLVHIAVCCYLKKCRRKSSTNYNATFNNTGNVE